MRNLLIVAALAFVTPALAYTPVICEHGWTGEICYQLLVNPSAKIIRMKPVEHIAEPEIVPLPRPRPPGLGEAPPRPVIQQ